MKTGMKSGSGAFVDSSVENKKYLTFTDKLSPTLIRPKVLDDNL